MCVCVGVIPKNVFIYACMDSNPPHLNHLNYLISLASSNTFYDWANRLWWALTVDVSVCECVPGTLADPCTRKYSSEIQMHSLTQSPTHSPTHSLSVLFLALSCFALSANKCLIDLQPKQALNQLILLLLFVIVSIRIRIATTKLGTQLANGTSSHWSSWPLNLFPPRYKGVRKTKKEATNLGQANTRNTWATSLHYPSPCRAHKAARRGQSRGKGKGKGHVPSGRRHLRQAVDKSAKSKPCAA